MKDRMLQVEFGKLALRKDPASRKRNYPIPVIPKSRQSLESAIKKIFTEGFDFIISQLYMAGSII